ncbi:DUF4166 domain-containing protein [Microbacterium sp. K41]|uniref:DUF4166 domain-containing protein n=1 Tax=Microbacterium sp. K41 TaxID=2305437 RepID=UPI00109D56A2|nr:DUF4166 domain-containing protein [Microbacterium sp. K41]
MTETPPPARGQVLLDALGAEAERLHPELLASFRRPSAVGHAEGVFTIAGSRFGRWSALARPVVGPRLLVTARGRAVPFTLMTVSGRSPSGRATLDSVRVFGFSRGAQEIADRLTVSVRPGLVRNLLGSRGRVELIEACSVTPEGFLRMSTVRVALRLCGRRVALRGPLGVHVDLVDGWDEEHRRRTIDMRAVNPVLGTVLEYRGWYREQDRHAAAQPGSQPGS